MFIYSRLFGFNFLAKRAAESIFFSSRLLQGLSDSDTLNFCSFFFPPAFAISGTVYDKQSIPRSLVSILPVWPPGSLHIEVLDVSVKHTAQGLAAPGAARCLLDTLKRKMNHHRSLKSEKSQEDVRGQEEVFPPGDETLEPLFRIKNNGTTIGDNS